MRTAVIIVFAFGTLARAQDPGARERPDWGSIRDSLEIRRLELDVRRAELTLKSTDIWHRLIPRVSVGASFGLRGVTFVEAAEANSFVMPTDAYRLTASLCLSDLIISDDHERARLMNEQAQLEVSLEKTKQLVEQQMLEERARRLRSELCLVEEMLRLSERLLRYTRILFDQGKTSFDVYLRCELQTIEARQNVLRLRSELGEISLN